MAHALQSKVAVAQHISRSGSGLLLLDLLHQSNNNGCNDKPLFISSCDTGSAFLYANQKGSLAGAELLDVAPSLTSARLHGCCTSVWRLEVPCTDCCRGLVKRRSAGVPTASLLAKPAEPHSRCFLLHPPPALGPGARRLTVAVRHKPAQRKASFHPLSSQLWEPGRLFLPSRRHHLLALHLLSGEWQECE